MLRRREAEADPGPARYAALLRSAVGRGALVVLATDRRGQCVVADGEALGALGLDPDIIGRGLVDALTSHPELQRLVARALEGEPVNERARAGGRWFDVALGPAPGGGIAGVAVPADWAFPGDDALPPFAFQDPQTQLPTRSLLFDRCRMALARARRHGGHVGVLLVGLDRLGHVNESLGYDAGDRVLLDLAWRCVASVRPSDTVARATGDTFVVLCDGLARPADIEPIAERLRHAVEQPFVISDREVHLTCSLGATSSEAGVGDPSTLMSQAEAAMKAAKRSGPGRMAVFDESMGSGSGDRLELEHAFRQALDRSELVLHYQPIIDLRSEQVVGLEALVRWLRPGIGLVPPAAFIPMAEETGLIATLGAWVLREGARQFERWTAQHVEVSGLTLSINVSAAQLADRRLEEHVDAAMETLGPRLRLEITESVLMDPGVVDVLQRIHDRGVSLAVDDFGTGYSSLSYLTRLPIDELKVDRAFVAGLEERPADRAVAAAVVGLARSLGLETVGEGVETVGQRAALRQLGCDRAQGYLFAEPLPPDALASMLTNGRPRPSAGGPAGP